MDSFNKFDLPQGLAESLKKMNFSKPTAIQAQAIPLVLGGRDLIATAQTGTGKTGAFAIPLVAKMLASNLRTLVLVPTRELAMQVQDVFKALTHHSPQFQTTLLIGGKSMFDQKKALSRKPRIIIATPGRLNDHLRQGHLSLKDVGHLVLDEADRMLDMGFLPQLKSILPFLPKTRQSLAFSATFPPPVRRLAEQFLHNPESVAVGAITKPVTLITQSTAETTAQQKNNLLLDELNRREGSVLIFTRTKSRTDRLRRFLGEYGYKVTSIHGGRTQGQRNSAIRGFRDGHFRILVATDIAARGLDIDHVNHVINYDLPQTPEDYVHRIGRTGRAGRTGEALSLLLPEDRKMWGMIQKQIGGNQKIANQSRPTKSTDHPKPTQGPAQATPPSGNVAGAQKANAQRPKARSQRGHGHSHNRPKHGKSRWRPFHRSEKNNHSSAN